MFLYLFGISKLAVFFFTVEISDPVLPCTQKKKINQKRTDVFRLKRPADTDSSAFDTHRTRVKPHIYSNTLFIRPRNVATQRSIGGARRNVRGLAV
jgi:hypothetical protein